MIYHYTTTETLFKILESKKIRLNRLDQVDDKTEEEAFKGINFAKYIFISSWTMKEDEDLYQWEKYAKNNTGVRIGFPEHMFKLKYVSESMYENGKYNGIRLGGSTNILLKPEEVFTNEYEILPIFFHWNTFYLKVNYVDSVYEIKEKIEEISRTINNFNMVLKDDWLIKSAATKNKIWRNQEESRFVLFIFPSLPKVVNGYDNPVFLKLNLEYKKNCILSNKPPNIKYFDLELSQDALNNIQIILGPNINENDKEKIITKVNNEYESVIIKESVLTGTLREKT